MFIKIEVKLTKKYNLVRVWKAGLVKNGPASFFYKLFVAADFSHRITLHLVLFFLLPWQKPSVNSSILLQQ